MQEKPNSTEQLLFEDKIINFLETRDEIAFQNGMKLVNLTVRQGFASVEYLQLCLLFYFDPQALKQIKLSEELRNLVDQINKVKFIEANTQLFKNNLVKILYSKISDFRLLLALFADKLNKINAGQKNDLFINLIESIYVPLSHIIGIHYYTTQFEDFIIRNKYEKEYNMLLKKAKKELLRDEHELDEIELKLEQFRKYPDEEIYGRIKSPYSVFKKVYFRKEPLENISDFVAFRVITKTEEDCYSWMGYIFSLWDPIQGKIKDYIERPKSNGYKSLHATVVTEKGLVEFQVRTSKMHEHAEYGIASHWRYKKMTDFAILGRLQKRISELENANAGFDMGKEKIFVYTPKRDILILDKGATVVDFAYAIHTELGHHIVRATINAESVPLDTVLKDHDVCSVFTDKNKKPSRSWLEFVKTKKAIDKIKQALSLGSEDKQRKSHEKTTISMDLLNKSYVAKCCNPFADDDLVLFKTQKRKYIIHTLECMLKQNKQYVKAPKQLSEKVLRKELLANIDHTLVQNIVDKVRRNIGFENIFVGDDYNYIVITLKIDSHTHFDEIKNKLLSIDGIFNVKLV